jgi:hypothetical protein
MRGAARSHHLRMSLRVLSLIPSTATQSTPSFIHRLLSHYLPYAMAVGESVISFEPSWLYGGKSGGRGFRGPFLSFSSSFAHGGGGANEGRACFSSGVARMKFDDTQVERRSSMSITTRGHQTYTCSRSQIRKLAARTLEATQFKALAKESGLSRDPGGKLGLQALF